VGNDFPRNYAPPMTPWKSRGVVEWIDGWSFLVLGVSKGDYII
jgi:hypothetical protein